GQGCHLIEADIIGHEAIQPGGDAYAPVVDAFGSRILNSDGTIDRRLLAREVFGQPGRLALLAGFVHPVVFRREQELIDRYTAGDPDGIVVVEAAIMIEAGSFRRYDRLIVVVCEEEQQIERAAERGMTREEALARIRTQLPLAGKRKLAHYVIDTSGDKEQTLTQVRNVFNALVQVNL
ncbi:MAG: dephospho-CoA kinase, partial [Bryobacteraceae bacterium]